MAHKRRLTPLPEHLDTFRKPMTLSLPGNQSTFVVPPKAAQTPPDAAPAYSGAIPPYDAQTMARARKAVADPSLVDAATLAVAVAYIAAYPNR